jgi:hypothetical protein
MTKLHPEPLPHPGEWAAIAPAGVPGDTGDEYDWNASDGTRTIVEQQPTTAAYWNPRGQVVIRQYRTGYDDEDQFVFFGVEALPKLIAALQQFSVEAPPSFESAAQEAPVGQTDQCSTPTQRRRRDAENLLITYPERSDRAIAREVGIDHKTVGSVRAAMCRKIPHPDLDIPQPAVPGPQPCPF